MEKWRYVDWIMLILCIIGFTVEFTNSPYTLIVEWLLGSIGLLYCLYYFCISVFYPIKRDWILVKGRFLIKIVNFVLLVPFVITIIFNCIDGHADNDNELTASHLFAAENTSDAYEPTNETTQQIADRSDGHTLFWAVYYHFIDPGNQHMANSGAGKTRAALIAVLGFLLLNGLLISTLISWFDRRREQWINGGIRYDRLAMGFKKVAIVIGANDSTPTIIKRLLNNCGEQPIDYVILLTNENVETVREQILSYLSCSEETRVIIYNGQLDSIEEIYKLHIKHATEIYVVGENSNDDLSHSYHDTQNMRCVHNIASYLSHNRVKRKIICRVSFEYQTTYSVFQFSDLPDHIKQHLIFIPFNPFENWAQRVLVTGEYTETFKQMQPERQKSRSLSILDEKFIAPVKNYIHLRTKGDYQPRVIKYTPLDGTGINPTSKNYVHFIVVGMSKMGIAMAIQAAQVGHYPNFTRGLKNDNNEVLREPSLRRTRITFIDDNADTEMDFFKGRYLNLFELARYRYIDASGKACDINVKWEDPMLAPDCNHKMLGDNFIDIEWEFVKGNVQNPGVATYLKHSAKQANSSLEERALLTIAICHPLAHEAIAAALYMPNEVYDHAQQILVYQREASDIVYNLSSKDGVYAYKRYAKLRPFGMRYADFTMDKDNFHRSRLCNYVYTLIADKTLDNKKLIPEIISKMDISKGEEIHMRLARDKWKELSIFNKWSNRYMSNSFETKLRCIGASSNDISLHYDKICSLFEEHKIAMAECEHNRWNVQQLLMGFRAYRDDELKQYKALKTEMGSSEEAELAFKAFKDRMKNSPEKVHLNICSASMLHDLDRNVEGYDVIFNSAIPAILKIIEKYNKENGIRS